MTKQSEKSKANHAQSLGKCKNQGEPCAIPRQVQKQMRNLGQNANPRVEQNQKTNQCKKPKEKP